MFYMYTEMSYMEIFLQSLCSCRRIYAGEFDCFGGFRFIREFLTHMETLPLPAKDCKVWICPLSSEGFFNVSYLLWHGTSVYKCNLRPVAERLAVELSLPVFTI